MTPHPSPHTKGGTPTKYVCTIHSIPFVRPEPFHHGGKLRVPAARCPICVEEQREKVRKLIEKAKGNYINPTHSQREVVMVEDFQT